MSDRDEQRDAAVTLPPLPPSNLLIADRPLLVMPRLVAFVGLNEAIVLQQVRYWLNNDLRPQVRDGRRWVYNTYEAWQQRNFPFWSVATVKRAFGSLERQGLLESGNYNPDKRDHTKWYTVSFARLDELERLYRAAHNAPGARGRPAKVAAAAAPPATDLLLDEDPLLLLPKLATAIGFDEALVLQQVRYWLGDRRAPLVRDGRRWCRCALHRWHEQFPFRSAPTINRALRALTDAGLLVVTSAYNRGGGDRTLWYTIDFERVAALGHAPSPVDGAPSQQPGDPDMPAVTAPLPAPDSASTSPIDQNAPNQSIKMRLPELKVVPALDQIALPQSIDLPRSLDHPASPDSIDLPPSIKEPETIPEIPTEIPQQQTATVIADRDPGLDVVVVPHLLLEQLVERGVTRAVAARIAAEYPLELIAAQLASFDRQRGENPGDPRFSAGRLRRMIEEDWAAPTGYPRPTGSGELCGSERPATDSLCMNEQRQKAGGSVDARAHQELLERIGLDKADQALWARVAQQSPPLPAPFRTALFHAPRDEMQTAAVIFPDTASLARALGSAHRATRSTVVARVAALCYAPGSQVHYFDLPTLCRQLGIDAQEDSAS